MPPTSLSFSFSPCRREQVRLRRRREGGDFEPETAASPVVTVKTSFRSSSFSVRMREWGQPAKPGATDHAQMQSGSQSLREHVEGKATSAPTELNTTHNSVLSTQSL